MSPRRAKSVVKPVVLPSGHKGPEDGIGRPTARERIWSALLEHKTLTAGACCRMTKCNQASVRLYFRALIAAGHADQTDDPVFGVTLRDGAPSTAPRVRVDGSTVTEGTARAKAWRAMPGLKTFTIRDLHVLTGLGEADATKWCREICEAGYLRRVPNRSRLTYALVQSRWSGPLPPQVTRVKMVWDPNLAKFVWPLAGEDLPEGRP